MPIVEGAKVAEMILLAVVQHDRKVVLAVESDCREN